MLKKAGWLDCYSYEESIELFSEFALEHARQAGRFSDLLSNIIAERRWGDLLDFTLDYRDSDDYLSLYHTRQALAFFQKLEPLKLQGAESKTLRAFRAFAKTEVSCRKVNDRFCNYRLGTPMEFPFDVILTDAREKIGRILQNAPSLSDLDLTFGPGATVSTKKKESCFRVKLGTPPECSNELAPFVGRLLDQVPLYRLLHGTLCEGSAQKLGAILDSDSPGPADLDYEIRVRVVKGKLQFVPKDAMKFRTIIVEPSMNVLFQQGVGKAIRKRLKKVGIDLSRQDRNRTLAKLGSESNSIATVDFSSASDNIASQVVAFLLPSDWFTLLSLARTRHVEFEGLEIALEKFSSMGNSFTFELESLIFWALAWSVLRYLKLPNKDLSIFGDDLIIPREAFGLCELVFAFCGFTINDRKSFRDGPFRESCGGDFFKGIDIRPFYQKHLATPESLFTLHNYYMRNGELALAKRVRSKIHPDLLIFGPDGYGDGHLIGDWTPLRRKVKVQTLGEGGKARVKRVFPQELGWSGCFFNTFKHVTPQELRPHDGDVLLPAYSIYARGAGESGEPSPQSSSQGKLWADPKYFTVPGSVGYEKISIYTQRRGIFVP